MAATLRATIFALPTCERLQPLPDRDRLPRHVATLRSAMVLAALIYVTADWSRLWTHHYSLSPLSNALKLLTSYLATGMAWTLCEARAVDAADRRRMRLLFALVAVADTLFMAHAEPVGVILFLVFHALLAARNLRGLRVALATGMLPWGRACRRGQRDGARLGAVSGLALSADQRPGAARRIPFYVLFSFASFMAAFASRYIGHFPGRNTTTMAWGVALFLACDLTVGCNLVWPAGERAQVWSSSLTWMLYAPALALIAQSAYGAPRRLGFFARG